MTEKTASCPTCEGILENFQGLENNKEERPDRLSIYEARKRVTQEKKAGGLPDLPNLSPDGKELQRSTKVESSVTKVE